MSVYWGRGRTCYWGNDEWGWNLWRVNRLGSMSNSCLTMSYLGVTWRRTSQGWPGSCLHRPSETLGHVYSWRNVAQQGTGSCDAFIFFYLPKTTLWWRGQAIKMKLPSNASKALCVSLLFKMCTTAPLIDLPLNECLPQSARAVMSIWPYFTTLVNAGRQEATDVKSII